MGGNCHLVRRRKVVNLNGHKVAVINGIHRHTGGLERYCEQRGGLA